jgi:hypothetical protein
VKLKPNADGRLWCDELNLWLGAWDGEFHGFREVWVRFFTPDGQVVPVLAEVADEMKRRAEAAEAELARLKSQMTNPSASAGSS